LIERQGIAGRIGGQPDCDLKEEDRKRYIDEVWPVIGTDRQCPDDAGDGYGSEAECDFAEVKNASGWMSVKSKYRKK
jgi:hypothetical protein